MLESGSRTVKFSDLRRILACYDYSVGWFVSQMWQQDEKSAKGEKIAVQPLSIVQKRTNFFLIDGSVNEGSYRLVLMRLLRSAHDIEILEMLLPPQSQMNEYETTVNAEIRGVVQRGTLLVILKGDEYVVRQGEEFCFDGSIPHILRNYTAEPTLTMLIVCPAAL